VQKQKKTKTKRTEEKKGGPVTWEQYQKMTASFMEPSLEDWKQYNASLQAKAKAEEMADSPGKAATSATAKIGKKPKVVSRVLKRPADSTVQ